MYGYHTLYGYMGLVGDTYMPFETEQAYIEYITD